MRIALVERKIREKLYSNKKMAWAIKISTFYTADYPHPDPNDKVERTFKTNYHYYKIKPGLIKRKIRNIKL